MSAVLPSTVRPSAHFANAAEWLRALGGVPLERILIDPPPGTATEMDLLRLVERDKRLCELIDGTLVEKPVGFWEGLIAARLITFLTIYANKLNLGAVFGADSTMRMKMGNVRLPDVSFVSLGRLPRTREAIPSLAPDLAVEVLSESNTAREMEQKLAEYFQSGTMLAWIIDPPTRTASIYHSSGKPARILHEMDLLDGENVLPGLSIPIADLFQGIPR
jgi:Uma2 family endonuclease